MLTTILIQPFIDLYKLSSLSVHGHTATCLRLDHGQIIMMILLLIILMIIILIIMIVLMIILIMMIMITMIMIIMMITYYYSIV